MKAKLLSLAIAAVTVAVAAQSVAPNDLLNHFGGLGRNVLPNPVLPPPGPEHLGTGNGNGNGNVGNFNGNGNSGNDNGNGNRGSFHGNGCGGSGLGNFGLPGCSNVR